MLPECARGKRKDEGCWPLVLARRARVVKLIVTLWAVLVEARSKRPITLVAERISSKLGRTIIRAQWERHAYLPRRHNKQAWKEHLYGLCSPNARIRRERISLGQSLCSGKRRLARWSPVLAQRPHRLDHIVKFWAVRVEARTFETNRANLWETANKFGRSI